MAVLLTLIALQAASSASAISGPPIPPKPKKTAAASTCKTPVPVEPGVIVVCAERPQGYRIDADVLAARKLHRDRSGAPKRELLKDTACQTVGPAGCINQPMIDLVQAAAAAVNMARTALKGGNVGKLFVTNPEPSEYQLYVAAKQDREAAEEAKLDAAAVAEAASGK